MTGRGAGERTDERTDELRDALLDWAPGQLRDTPWRRTRDPWRVLVSETMLQQTQVDRVLPRYERFVERFADPASCAAADRGEVISLWQGLGYNRRAVALHRAAAIITAQHDGQVPADLEELLALPGVGPYTARAVRVFAHDCRDAVVDVNVHRVLRRAVHGGPLSPTATQALADELVAALPAVPADGRDRSPGWWWNQAIMELGARHCRSRGPRCEQCPLLATCAWARRGWTGGDPAADVGSRQSRFEGSDRQGRGRIVDALRAGPLASADLAAVTGWDDPDRVEAVVDSLVADGLATFDRGYLRLPDLVAGYSRAPRAGEQVAEHETLPMRQVLEDLAPGSLLREAIERIIGAGRGALIVLAHDDAVRATITGGFEMDARATSQRLAELAKMDGALIVGLKDEKIHHANVHLVPDASIPTSETGTRHRTAERVARQTGAPVISVSESMSRVTLYLGDRKHVLEGVSSLLARANQALATLERYRTRLTEVSTRLSTRELADEVTLRDVCTTLQRSEMVRRIEAEVADVVGELGHEGRLIELQRAELTADVDQERRLLVEDYRVDRRRQVDTVLRRLAELTSKELLDLGTIATTLGHDEDGSLDAPVRPRGYRLLARIPRLPDSVTDRLIRRFTTIPTILAAGIDELQAVDGVGEARASSILEGLRRMQDSAHVER